MNTPIRVQRKRTKGWKAPENTVYVGRPTRWGNQFKVGNNCTHEEAVQRFAVHMNLGTRMGAKMEGMG